MLQTLTRWPCILGLMAVALNPTAARSAQDPDIFDAMQKRILAIAEENNPKVVHIKAILKVQNRSIPGTGTGMIIDPQCHVLTNHHVVENAEKVTLVVPGDKRRFDAEVVGTDPQTDIAVLKFKYDKPCNPVRTGDSSKVHVGDWVIAIGNPYGLDGSVSFGIISAIQRNLNVGGLLNEFIQTDAMIDFGSSGGPLYNLKGDVIGINSRGQGRGIGFTIPINLALEIKQNLVQEGQVERSWLGVSIQNFDRDLADYLGMPDTTGVIINQVHEGSAADKAGLRPGDILTVFDGQKMDAEEEQDLKAVTRLIAKLPVGKKVTMHVLRDKKPLTLNATLTQQPTLEGKREESDLGFQVTEITKVLMIQQNLKSREGVLVTFVEQGSVADEGGLAAGDTIQFMDNREIKNIKEFKSAAAAVSKKKRTLVKVLRNNSLFFVLLKNDRKKPKAYTQTE